MYRYLGLVKKRDDFNEEGWYDTPVTEKVVGGAELQDPGQGRNTTFTLNIRISITYVFFTSRKHAYIILSPLNPTFI